MVCIQDTYSIQLSSISIECLTCIFLNNTGQTDSRSTPSLLIGQYHHYAITHYFFGNIHL